MFRFNYMPHHSEIRARDLVTNVLCVPQSA